MEEKEIFKAETSTELELPMYEGLQAGFPSPATDYQNDRLDFNRDFIRHPERTFYGCLP
jgi:DNA polymerase V